MYVEYEDISLDILRYPNDMLDLGHCEYEDISG